jgi:hypothetical protein
MREPNFYLTLDLPKNFNRKDAEKIRDEVLDFLNSKNYDGAMSDGKNNFTVKIVTVSTNHD